METEFFERFISHLSLARCAMNDYASLYLNKEYGYNIDVMSGKDNGIEGLNSMFEIVYASINTTIFVKAREEVLSNILSCNSNNYMVIANFYINRIVSTQLNKLFIYKDYRSWDMEEFLSSNEPHKKLYAVCNTLSDNCMFYALHNLIINAPKEYNKFIRFLYDTFLSLKVNLIPFYIDRNIHFYECDDYGDYLTDLTLNDISNKTTQNICQLVLPKELDTPKAKDLFNKAIEAGLITDKASFYKWNYSKSLLAYFIDKLSYHLDIIPSNNNTPWRHFKPIFNIAKNDNSLVIAKNEYKNKGNGLPQDSYLVDILF